MTVLDISKPHTQKPLMFYPPPRKESMYRENTSAHIGTGTVTCFLSKLWLEKEPRRRRWILANFQTLCRLVSNRKKPLTSCYEIEMETLDALLESFGPHPQSEINERRINLHGISCPTYIELKRKRFYKTFLLFHSLFPLTSGRRLRGDANFVRLFWNLDGTGFEEML